MDTNIQYEMRIINAVESLFASYRDSKTKLLDAQESRRKLRPEINGETAVVAKDYEIDFQKFEVDDLRERILRHGQGVNTANQRAYSNKHLVEEFCIALRHYSGQIKQLLEDDPDSQEIQLIMYHSQKLIEISWRALVSSMSQEIEAIAEPLLAEVPATAMEDLYSYDV